MTAIHESTRPVVEPGHLEEGARWELIIRSSGKRVEYVLSHCVAPAVPGPTGKTPGLCAMYALTNPATGKDAQVSEKWLREGLRPNMCGYWTPLAIAPQPDF